MTSFNFELTFNVNIYLQSTAGSHADARFHQRGLPPEDGTQTIGRVQAALVYLGRQETDVSRSKIGNRNLIDDLSSVTSFTPQDSYPKGEIFLGHASDGYSVEPTMPLGWKVRDQGFVFHIKTPYRSFVFSAERVDDREEWINVIRSIINKPMTPQDAFCRSILNPKACKKRNSFF